MLQARIAIQHKECWGSKLTRIARVRDVRFLAGIKVDSDRILGSMEVRSEGEIDLMEYNPYDVEYVAQEKTDLGEPQVQYDVDFIFRPDEEDPPVISLLFDSGCLFEPPAVVQGEYELHTILAPKLENLQHLVQLVEGLGRPFRILSMRGLDGDRRTHLKKRWMSVLTPKQLNAIRVALERGFYQYPRRVRISDLAKVAKVARSTFQEHLRLAEIKLIRFLMNAES